MTSEPLNDIGLRVYPAELQAFLRVVAAELEVKEPEEGQ
jgi:hypothetical protein